MPALGEAGDLGGGVAVVGPPVGDHDEPAPGVGRQHPGADAAARWRGWCGWRRCAADGPVEAAGRAAPSARGRASPPKLADAGDGAVGHGVEASRHEGVGLGPPGGAERRRAVEEEDDGDPVGRAGCRSGPTSASDEQRGDADPQGGRRPATAPRPTPRRRRATSSSTTSTRQQRPQEPAPAATSRPVATASPSWRVRVAVRRAWAGSRSDSRRSALTAIDPRRAVGRPRSSRSRVGWRPGRARRRTTSVVGPPGAATVPPTRGVDGQRVVRRRGRWAAGPPPARSVRSRSTRIGNATCSGRFESPTAKASTANGRPPHRAPQQQRHVVGADHDARAVAGSSRWATAMPTSERSRPCDERVVGDDAS